MSTTAVIWTIVIIVVVVALIGLIAASMRKKSRQDNAARAGQLREEAGARASGIPDAHAQAQEAEVKAEQARLVAQRAEERATEANQGLSQQQAAHEDQLRAADRLDPDVNTRAKDYTPDISTPVTGAAAASDKDRTAGDPDKILDTHASDTHGVDSAEPATAAEPVPGRPVDDREYDASGQPVVDPHHDGPRFDSEGRPIDTGETGSHRA